MTDHIKWTLNHLPPGEDSRLDIMEIETDIENSSGRKRGAAWRGT